MNDVNKLEQVKTELADAIRVWYLRHAEDIAGDAGKSLDFVKVYGDGGNVGTWAEGIAAKVAADAGDFFSGTAASVRLTKGDPGACRQARNRGHVHRPARNKKT